MKIQELQQLSKKKLIENLKKFRRELAVIFFHVRTGQNKNSAQIKKLKKTIARILTLLKIKKFEK